MRPAPRPERPRAARAPPPLPQRTRRRRAPTPGRAPDQQPPPVFKAPPVEVRRHPPAAARPAPLDPLQPGRGGRHPAHRLAPADTVVHDLLGVFGEVVEQRPGQRRRNRGRPPQVRRQIADHQRPHRERQALHRRPGRVQRHLLGQGVRPPAGDVQRPHRNAGRHFAFLRAWLAHQQQRPAGWTASISGVCSLIWAHCSRLLQKITRLAMRRCTGAAPGPSSASSSRPASVPRREAEPDFPCPRQERPRS